MNEKVLDILEKVKTEYSNYNTILVFGSATTEGWTGQSDIDVFLIDDAFNDSRSEKEYDGILVEFQEDNFETIKKHMDEERGNLLHRNLSNMIATATVVATKSPEKIDELVDFAKEILASRPNYDEEDVKMWRYSILDYLGKVEKDIQRNDEIAFYIDAHYVLQNALEMSLAIHETYMPQPKNLAKLLDEKDPEFLQIWLDYLRASDLNEKLEALNRIKDIN